MKSAPEFSVVIPVHNREKFVLEAVNSVLSQTLADLEIIVVNDGSTDRSEERIRSVNDTRIKIITQSNRERGAARNAGMENARGRYITFLDSDDIFLPGHLARTSEELKKAGYPDAYCSSYIIEGAKQITIIPGKHVNMQLINGNILSCCGVFLKRESAGQLRFCERREMSGFEDWELWLRVAASFTFRTGDTRSCKLRQHDDRSVMNVNPAVLEKKIGAFLEEVGADDNVMQMIGAHIHRFRCSCYTYIALHLALTHKYKTEARRWLRKGIREWKGFFFTRRYVAILKHLTI